MKKVLVMESTYDTCREAVDRAFAAFPMDVRGKLVAVKMNALKPGDPDQFAYVTHYRLLEAVIQELKSSPNPLTLSVVGCGGEGPTPLANQPCW